MGQVAQQAGGADRHQHDAAVDERTDQSSSVEQKYAARKPLATHIGNSHQQKPSGKNRVVKKAERGDRDPIVGTFLTLGPGGKHSPATCDHRNASLFSGATDAGKQTQVCILLCMKEMQRTTGPCGDQSQNSRNQHQKFFSFHSLPPSASVASVCRFIL